MTNLKTVVRTVVGFAILAASITMADMREQPVCGISPDEAAINMLQLDSGKYLAWKTTARDLSYFDSEEGFIGRWVTQYFRDVERVSRFSIKTSNRRDDTKKDELQGYLEENVLPVATVYSGVLTKMCTHSEFIHS